MDFSCFGYHPDLESRLTFQEKWVLAPSGRLLIPLGGPDGVQWLTKLTREPDGRFVEERIEEVRFVPLICG
ncbi:hypothetical protein [Bradyrhizobium liaoningense]|uniref:hypothetical protein n=1 Tax=Bradyrhizobium liaoningense TaxID=43992 RepID=UPI0012FD266D